MKSVLFGPRGARVLQEKVSIVVPAFNESTDIAQNLRAIVETFLRFAPDFEVILVDDGSNDETWRHAAESVCPSPEKIRILRYDKNQGKGFALACGTRYATGKYVVFLDADLDLHPDQVPHLYDVMVAEDADAVIGSKWHPRSKVDYPAWRSFLSRGYYLMVRVLFGLPLRDTQTGLKLFRADPLKHVTARLLSKRFAFDIELLAVMHRFGYKIVEAPVELRSKRSLPRLRMADVWSVLNDTMAIFYRIYLRRYYDRDVSAAQTAHDVREFTAGLTPDH
jgi:glycosyltransferase involved in cell wall biosynthesis